MWADRWTPGIGLGVVRIYVCGFLFVFVWAPCFYFCVSVSFVGLVFYLPVEQSVAFSLL